ncbi:hypothetical protein, partial [Bacteroides thetaiotaomicron]|uniref:hypothetical protein n=1 Tax=Bacteroides thetaiotaomicron TaxID=818 RepID=UPI000AE41175
FAGFVLTLFSKKSRFGRLRRELGEMKKSAPFCLLLFLGLSGTLGTQALYAQSRTGNYYKTLIFTYSL